jgi:hypothetical protein
MAAVATMAAMGVTTTAAAADDYREQWNPPRAQQGVAAPRALTIAGGPTAANACLPASAGAGPDDEGALKAGAAMLGLWPKEAGHRPAHVVTGQIVGSASAATSGARGRGAAGGHPAVARALEVAPHHAINTSGRANVWHRPAGVAQASEGASRHAIGRSRRANVWHEPAGVAHASERAPHHAISRSGRANVWHQPMVVAHAPHRTTNTVAAAHATAGASHHAVSGGRDDSARRQPVAVAHAPSPSPHAVDSRRAPATSAHPEAHHRLVVDTKPAKPGAMPNPLRRELPPIIS